VAAISERSHRGWLATTGAASGRADAAPGRRTVRFSLRTALVGLILASVVTTAALIHLSWRSTARENVGDIVRQLNREIIVGLKYEITGVLANATAARDALHTIFFQDVVDTRNEAKREFVVLAALQSQPSLSWAMIGWPDGTFFGARKGDGDDLEMVEVARDGENGALRRRIDTYTPVDGDIMFRERAFAASDFLSTSQPWYQRAVQAEDGVWADASVTPAGHRPAIAAAKRLSVYQEFVGVVAIAVDFARLSRYLDTIAVGKTGSVYVIDTAMRVLAAQLAAGGDTLKRLEGLPRASARIAAAAMRQDGTPLSQIVEPREIRYRDPTDGKTYFVSVTPVDFSDWYVTTVVPESDFLADVERKTLMVLIQVAVVTVVAAALAALISSVYVAAPFKRVTSQLGHIESFRLERIARVSSPLVEVDSLSSALVQMARGLASFQKFLPTALVRTLVSQGVEAKPGGAIQPLTVMFSALVGFTHLSDALGDRIVDVLGRYLSDMSRAVAEHGGTIDKFIGDSVMAFWGAPTPDRSHAAKACFAALACQAMLRASPARYSEPGQPPLRMRIGINTGDVVVGNIGSDERLNYTAIGDAVNIASRLEALNKRYGSEIIIGETTRTAVGDAFVVRLLDRVAVYGRVEGTRIYELVARREERDEQGVADWISAYERGLALYERQQWSSAVARFDRVITLRSGIDVASSLMIERCRVFEGAPPSGNWNGVWTWDGK